MKLEELQKSYPLAVDKAKEFIIERINKTASDVPEDFVDQIKERANDMLSSTLDNNPRTLLDMFDRNGVYIEIGVIYANDEDDITMFKYRILPRDNNKNIQNEGKFSYMSEDRKEIEYLAVKDAFSVLEKQLKNQLNDGKETEQVGSSNREAGEVVWKRYDINDGVKDKKRV